jgi:hypothetical protein
VRCCFSVEQRAHPIRIPARGIGDCALSAPSFIAGATFGAEVSVIVPPPSRASTGLDPMIARLDERGALMNARLSGVPSPVIVS